MSKLSPEERHRLGFQAIAEKLGLAEAIRFIQDLVPGKGDYSAERHQWLPTDLDEVLPSLAFRKSATQPALLETAPGPTEIPTTQFSPK